MRFRYIQKIKESNIFLLLNLVIVCFTVYSLSRKTIFSDQLVWSTWSFSEFLIYYPENMFVRRGLLGEFFIFLSNGGPVLEVVQIFVFINFLIFICLTSIVFFIYKSSTTQYLLFLLSSFGFLNLVLYDISYHRKEILALNIFLIFLILKKFDASKTVRNINIFYLFISTLLISLIHEGMLLMLFPFYIIILKTIEDFNSLHRIKVLYSVFTFSIILVLILNSGSEELSALMFSGLHPEDRYLLQDYSVDAIRAIGWSLERALILPIRIFLSGNAFYWLYILFLMFFSIYIILFNNTFLSFKEIILDFHKENYILIITYSIFFIGWDWGRWFVIIFYLYLLTFIYLNFLSNFVYDSNFSVSIILFYIIISILTIVPECCLSWTDPKIFNMIENYIGEIKINY